MTALVPEAAMHRRSDVVVLVVPAEGGYLSVLRTATAGLAARLQLTLDEIEDLRIAVDEACAILIGLSGPKSDVTCQFDMSPQSLIVAVSVPVQPGATLPDEGSFSWQVLSALAGEVRAEAAGERAVIQLTKRRSRGA